MDQETFDKVVNQAISRSITLLNKKGKEYTSDDDRLRQFKKTAIMESKLPTETLFTMADKHISSIADMVNHPRDFTIVYWQSKVDDLRNYTFLLDALIVEMSEEE